MSNIAEKNEILTIRYNKLLELNNRNHFTFMILINGKLEPNPKVDKYLKLLLEIKRQKHVLRVEYRENNPEYLARIERAKNSTINLIRGMYSNTK